MSSHSCLDGLKEFQIRVSHGKQENSSTSKVTSKRNDVGQREWEVLCGRPTGGGKHAVSKFRGTAPMKRAIESRKGSIIIVECGEENREKEGELMNLTHSCVYNAV